MAPEWKMSIVMIAVPMGTESFSEAPEGQYVNVINRVAVFESIVREQKTLAAANESEPETLTRSHCGA